MPPYNNSPLTHYGVMFCKYENRSDGQDVSKCNMEKLEKITDRLRELEKNKGYLEYVDIYCALGLSGQYNKYRFYSGDWKLWKIHILQEQLRLNGLLRFHAHNQSGEKYTDPIEKDLDDIREALWLEAKTHH